jgi:thiol-disulfide isomerase/thioredoxin
MLQVLCRVNFKFLKMKKNLLILSVVLSYSLTAQIKIGDTLPVITLKDSNNHEVISTTNQKFTLVDFWGSYCAPCRRTNKELVTFNETYANQNFQIIGISLDTDKTKWLKAVEKDKITYLQLNDPNGFDATTAVRFGVEQLPASFLFDPSGKLISINPTPQQIRTTLNLK